MPAPTICTVTGTLRGVSGQAVAGATVRANITQPFMHPTDGSLVTSYEASTTTAGDGTWSLDLVETATPVVSVVITFYYSTGSNNPNAFMTYSIIVPNQASATFQSLLPV